jgi:hypothetical protein
MDVGNITIRFATEAQVHSDFTLAKAQQTFQDNQQIALRPIVANYLIATAGQLPHTRDQTIHSLNSNTYFFIIL